MLDSVATPSGLGYYMVAADGGVFAFGDAQFYGSTGAMRLNEPVQSLVPDPDGAGYWLVAADGGVFAFQAEFRGSMPAVLQPGQRLNRPVTGMVSYGDGYLMVATDGAVFNFSNLPFDGSLGDVPPPWPVVSVTPVPSGILFDPGGLVQPTGFVLSVGPRLDVCVNPTGGTAFPSGPCHIITMTWVGQDSDDVLHNITPASIGDPDTTLPIGAARYPHVGADYTWTFAMRPAANECVCIRAYTPDLSEYTEATTTCPTTP